MCALRSCHAMWVPGSEVRESVHAAQLGSLGAWGPGPWVVPRVGLNKGPSGEREAAGTLSLRCLLLSRLSHRWLHTLSLSAREGEPSTHHQ